MAEPRYLLVKICPSKSTSGNISRVFFHRNNILISLNFSNYFIFSVIWSSILGMLLKPVNSLERIYQNHFMAKLQWPFKTIYLLLEERLDLDITWMSITWISPKGIGIYSPLFRKHWILFKIMLNIQLPGKYFYNN